MCSTRAGLSLWKTMEQAVSLQNWERRRGKRTDIRTTGAEVFVHETIPFLGVFLLLHQSWILYCCGFVRLVIVGERGSSVWWCRFSDAAQSSSEPPERV